MKTGSARLCTGTVTHRRYRPVRHVLRYRVFSLLVDLDDLPDLARTSRWLRINRRGLVSIWESDHGDGEARGLKQHIEHQMARAGFGLEEARISMLTFPRVLGYVFNPLTVYFCLDRAGRLTTLVYEVNNTFGERHFYVVPAGLPNGGVHALAAGKAFHVSPFNDVEGEYGFRVAIEDDRVAVGVSLRVNGKPLLNAYHTAQTVPLTDRALLTALASMPLMTMKVIAGIHFEACRLWLKGLRIRKRPRIAPPIAPTRTTAPNS